MKKIFFTILTLILFVPFMVNAEEANLEWINGWNSDEYDYFKGVIALQDSGFLAYGYTASMDDFSITSNDRNNIIMVKYDKDGNQLWRNKWGGSKFDTFQNIQPTSDGGFIVYGNYISKDIEGISNNGSSDAMILKYDKDGNMLWQKNWGGNNGDDFVDLIILPDDGFVVIGFSLSTNIDGLSNKGSSDAIIVKYDKDGNMLWQKSWGGSDDDDFSKLVLRNDGGFVVYGYSRSMDIEGLINKGDRSSIVVKYDKDGNLLEQQCFGGNDIDYIEYKVFEDGKVIAYGSSYSGEFEGLINKGDRDAIIVGFDNEGNMQWQKSWGGNNNEEYSNITQTPDGGVIAFGYSQSSDIEGLPNKGSHDAIIVKYDKNGNMLWQKSWGGNNYDVFKGLISLENGDLVAYGQSSSVDIEGIINIGRNDAIIVKFDKDGNLLWQKNWGGTRSEYFNDIIESQNGGIIVSASSSSEDIAGLLNKGDQDTIIVKYDKDGNMLWQNSLGGDSTDYIDNLFKISDDEFIIFGYSQSSDIENLLNEGRTDAIIVKYSIKYSIEVNESENGTYTLTQQGSKGIITATPNEGYDVDEIIVKDSDGNVLDVEITKLEDGTYSFDLYTDVFVEVVYKQKIENPKTFDFPSIMICFSFLIICLSGYYYLYSKNHIMEI